MIALVEMAFRYYRADIFFPSVFQDQYKFCYEVALEYLNSG